MSAADKPEELIMDDKLWKLCLLGYGGTELTWFAAVESCELDKKENR